MQQTFTTNLRCASCLGAIQPVLDGDARISHWAVDLAAEGKPLTIATASGLTLEQMNRLLQPLGYAALQEVPGDLAAATTDSRAEAPVSYYPLLLILLYLVGMVAACEYLLGSWVLERAMRHFMAGFFLIFSFFKLLDVRRFAETYATYDIVAHRSRLYGLAYPFLELGLGIAYLLHWNPWITNLVTLVVMSISLVGVLETLLARRRIRCACLGTVFNLPMSVVTVIEDGLMIAMAAIMLLL